MDYDQLTQLAKPIVWARGRRLGLSDPDCEDVLQDVLTKHFTTWSTGAPDNLEAWLETTTRNTLIDRGRHAERRPADNFAEGGEDPLSLMVGLVRSSQFASLAVVTKQLIDDILALVPPQDADLLRRRFLDGQPAADLAGELGIPSGTVDQRVSRARRKLRTALEERPDLAGELRKRHPHIY